MSLSHFAAVMDDAPGCGTKPRPGRPFPRPHALSLAAGTHTARPDPSPWRDAASVEMAAAAFASLELYRVAQQLSGDERSALTGAAEAYFDGWCGSVPLSVLIAQLLGHLPPPPPEPWVERLTFAARTFTLAAGLQGDVKAQLSKAASTALNAGIAEVRSAVSGAPGAAAR